MTTKRISANTFWIVIFAICTLPYLLNLIGVDFGSISSPQPDKTQDYSQAMGSLHHALMEWSAIVVAILTAFATFLHYSRNRDITIPILGVALVCAAMVDVFHILASTQIISSHSEQKDFIPFTWALSRQFNALIIILGLGINLWLARYNIQKHRVSGERNRLLIIVVGFLLLTAVAIYWVYSSQSLPQTIYLDALISRPYDVLPLALFVIAGTLAWSWYKISHSIVKFALLVSLVPAVATQLHMAFGSTALFDSHFNIAHGLKIVTYTCIFAGVIFDLTLSNSVQKSKNPVETKPETENTNHISDLLPVGTPKVSLTLAIPATLFVLVLLVATIVGGTFYIDSEKLSYQKEITQLKIDGQFISPLLKQFYSTSASDLLFLSQTPPIEGIQQAIHANDPESERLWKHRLAIIFSRLLENKPYYRSIRYIDKNGMGRELVAVKRRRNDAVIVPEGELLSVAEEVYFQQTLSLDMREFYLSDVGLEKRSGEIVRPYTIVSQIATPVFSYHDDNASGMIIIDTNFGAVIDEVISRTPDRLQLYLANFEGDFIYHPQNHKAFGFEFNERYTMQEEFPTLRPVIQQGKEEHFLTNVSVMPEDDQTPQHDSKIAGYYALVELEALGENTSLHILLTINENALNQELRALRDRSLIIGLSLALLTLAFAILISRKFVLPIQQMAHSMREFSKTGRTPALPIEGKDELAILARNFHNLTIQLAARDHELKEQKYALDQHAIVAVTDVKGIITYANQRFSDISGYSIEELVGQDHRIINSGYHDKAFFKEMYQTIAKGQVWHGEIRNQAKDGSFYWVDTTIAPFMQNGRPISYIAIRTDITSNKEYEERLLKAKEEAESATKVKSEFIASMSHEIRTPMNGVIGMIELLENTKMNKEQQQKLSVIKSSANSLLVIINDILDFSKIEAGKMELDLLPFDLSSQLTDYIQSMAAKADEKNLELILDMTELKHPHVIGDPGRIRQIFNNLIGNALKFTERGEVAVIARTRAVTPETVQFTCKVCDSGIGIPEDKLDVLFKSFRQVDASTTRKYGGTGLGLTIVKQLCELMQGDIWVSSEVGKGSTFEFTIPLKISEQPQLLIPQINLGDLNILVVDDNQTNLSVIGEQLRQWNIHVVEAISAEQALQLCEQRAQDNSNPMFDIAILDMQMPNVSGEELGKKLKSDSRFRSIKLIMMSSMTSKGDAQHFADIGFSAYFPKPTTPSILHDSLSVLLENGLAENYARPLVTSHYLKQLKNQAPTLMDIASIGWPENAQILLVEDNLVNQQVAEAILQEFGLAVDIAGNGQEALDKLVESSNHRPYTLILMDCLMPIMDGYDATREIRAGKAGKRYQDICIVALTANAMKQDREKCLQAGMDDFVAKPIATEELLNALKRGLLDRDQEKGTLSSSTEPPKQTEVSIESEDDEIWLPEAAQKQVANNLALLKKVVEQAIINIPQELQNLKTALAEEDQHASIRAAHTIKGVALTLHAKPVGNHALELEKLAKEGLLDKVQNALQEFEQRVNELTRAMSLFLNPEPQENISDETHKMLTDRQIYAQLITFEGILEKGTCIPSAQLQTLTNKVNSLSLKQSLMALQQSCEQGDVEKSKQILDDIIAGF